MNETDLRDRLHAGVDHIRPTDDFLDRVRPGGARRLRRRRFVGLGVAAVTIVAAGGVGALSVQAINTTRAEERSAAAAGPAAGDGYRFLWNRPTSGDLAGDKQYLDQVLTAWRTSHHKSVNEERGIFDYPRGEAKVYWAGKTSAGRAAIVIQQAYLRHHDNIQLDHEGLYTLVGWIGETDDGKPEVRADSYPVHGGGLTLGMVVQRGDKAAVVVIDPGKKVGLSTERQYPADSGSRREYEQLKFTSGVSVVELKRATDLTQVRINRYPATTYSPWNLTGTSWTSDPGGAERRLWSDFSDEASASWPMTPGAQPAGPPAEEFRTVLEANSDPDATVISNTLWAGYGTTPDGSRLLLGEHALDNDPTHVYAVLIPKKGKPQIVAGGVPDRDAVLPVRIKLPRDQGWSIARRDADLSYRLPGKQDRWSEPRKHALLVPTTSPQVRVTHNGKTETITLP